MKVGFIGLGNQGGPMATMIANAGHHLTVWARRPEVLSPFVELGAHTAETPAEVAARVDLLGICVVSDEDVNDVMLTKGALAAMPAGSTLAIHSTVALSTCRQTGRTHPQGRNRTNPGASPGDCYPANLRTRAAMPRSTFRQSGCGASMFKVR